MAIKLIEFAPEFVKAYAPIRGRDLHVLRGTPSRNLEESLTVTADPLPTATEDFEGTLAAYRASVQNDDDVEFRPVFKAILKGDEFEGRGLRVHQKTGVVSFVAGPVPLPVCNNFLIEAVVKLADGTLKPTYPTYIRVHLHTSVTRIWLTPNTLTIRRSTVSDEENTKFRFTVRAEFDDKTVGDVTVGHGVRWSPVGKIVPPPPATALWDDGFIRIPKGVLEGQSFDAFADAPALWGAVTTAKSTVAVAGPWNTDPKRPQAHLVRGDPSRPPELVPNVLFFGTGFPGVDLPSFIDLVTAVVDGPNGLAQNPLFSPWNVLSNSMNYWSVAGPASIRGIPVRSEVYLFPISGVGGGLFAQVINSPELPPPVDKWNRQHLAFAAGLPVINDLTRLNVAADPENAVKTLRAEWALTMRVEFQSTANDIIRLPSEVILLWLKFATRSFVDEIDIFPPLALGLPPTASQPVADLITLHDDRGGLAAVEPFFQALTTSSILPAGAGPLGLLWAKDQSKFRFSNRHLVSYLAVSQGTPVTGPKGIFLPLTDKTPRGRGPLVTIVPGRSAFALDPAEKLFGDLEEATSKIAGTAVHELAHAFGLGDEYGGRIPRFLNGDERTFDGQANLTSLAAVSQPDPADPNDDAKRRFNPDDIKWNWDRISHAAVITGDLSSQPGSIIEVPVVASHTAGFVRGEEVKLRARKWGSVLGLRPKTHPFGFRVEAIDSAKGLLTISYKLATTAVGDLGDFSEGSLVYAPVPAPISVRSVKYPYAKMISPIIESWIRTGGPLAGTLPGDKDGPDPEMNDAYGTRVPAAIDFFSKILGLHSHRDNSRIIGLYPGGDFFAYGVFHPAGTCTLRGSSNVQDRPFCYVCRYVLVDAIDPSRHSLIDAAYERDYIG
jgi:hypothetical protein